MLVPWTQYLNSNHFYLLDYVFDSSSTQAEDINRLHVYFLFAAAFILFVVIGCTVLVLLKFRHRQGVDYQPKSLSQKWEILTIGVPMLLVIVFFVLTLKTMHRVLPEVNGRKPDVVITGHQFWWEANYPAQKVITANEIHLPAGRTILLKLLSADVIHDWWVPDFGNKMDLVSGKENYLWLNIKKPGVYHGACSEFCGAQHAGMQLTVIAEGEDDYEKWLTSHASLPAVITDTIAQIGEKLFTEKTCGNCHNISGTSNRGRDGPDLTHLASRKTLLTGLIENNKDNLGKWILKPQEIKPGAKMPDFKMDKQSADEIVAYLSSLK
ncbi:cytochrome c oxidase subunit II [Segetibacter koreensis]|uniref:cytochrome c oxidase subunit II n=1 Tax=Segetibacter koreensis TaxID=398037 RepID=UPI000369680F|nr:cytochrome c oxidase subunit II [Segetibacter koreensis]